jgi:hypothetical protein
VEVEASIYDEAGELVGRVSGPGNQVLVWRAGGAAPGVYFIHLSARHDGGLSQARTLKVAVIR